MFNFSATISVEKPQLFCTASSLLVLNFALCMHRTVTRASRSVLGESMRRVEVGCLGGRKKTFIILIYYQEKSHWQWFCRFYFKKKNRKT